MVAFTERFSIGRSRWGGRSHPTAHPQLRSEVDVVAVAVAGHLHGDQPEVAVAVAVERALVVRHGAATAAVARRVAHQLTGRELLSQLGVEIENGELAHCVLL